MNGTLPDDKIMDEKVAIDKYFPPYISILLPELARPDYVLECIRHIQKYADMPYEIVLHDDGSPKEMQELLFNCMRELSSTIMFNYGHNVGLGRAQNRCRAMATSKYLLSFNTDVFMTSSFLKGIKEALDLPYVGVVNIKKAPESLKKGDPNLYITPSGYRVWLSRGTGDTIHFATRADVWDEVGGWNENVQSTSSDIGFLGKIFQHGYFSAVVDGTLTNEMWLKTPNGRENIHVPNPYYKSCLGPRFMYSRGDNNTPKIFGMDEKLHDKLCEDRREAIWKRVNEAPKELEHWYSAEFSCSQSKSLYPDDKFIDWEFAKKYGHDKWKEMITKDFNL